MSLPAGVTCGQCLLFQRCVSLFRCSADSETCEWFPRRFIAARTSPGAERGSHD
jgi:hypothetical protein